MAQITAPGVPLALLSQTIQDAVEVTRSLGLAYLWVDVLYVIQGQPDKADWTAESAKMGLVYANTYLTIAATSAGGASQGFLTRAHRSGVPVEFRVCRAVPYEGRIYFRECTEAWVQQERLLSRHTIDFSARQIYWTCRASRHSEGGQVDRDGAVEACTVLGSVNMFRITQGMREQQTHDAEVIPFVLRRPKSSSSQPYSSSSRAAGSRLSRVLLGSWGRASLAGISRESGKSVYPLGFSGNL